MSRETSSISIAQIARGSQYIEFNKINGTPVCVVCKQVEGLWTKNEYYFDSWIDLCQSAGFDPEDEFLEVIASALRPPTVH